MKRKLRPSSIDAISIRISSLVLVLWMVCMILTTYGCTIDLYNQMELFAMSHASMWAGTETVTTDTNREAPGYADYCRLSKINDLCDHIGIIPRFLPNSSIRRVEFYTAKDMLPIQIAVSYGYNDGERYVKLNSAGSYAYFGYITPEQWEAEAQPGQVSGYLYIDCDKLDESFGDTDAMRFYGHTLRLTGWFEGNEFHPTKAESGSGNFDWDRRDRIRWTTFYEAPAPADQEIVTVYYRSGSSWPFGLASTTTPVTIDGVEYAQLEDVLPTVAKKNRLTDAVVRGYGYYQDQDGNMVHVRIALRGNPLLFAMKSLLWFYGITLFIILLALTLILRSIRKNLTAPVAQVAECIAAGMKPLDSKSSPRWKESRELEQHYDAAATAYHEAQTKAIQLQTAMDYARNADEHRRKMISSITHELKTPLAVIHSYAEGLSDGIAAHKQEQYLNVILSETERMDAMVLQMLDLSRLEAGKVRLTAEQFSLLELTQAVFDRLAPMAQERQLQIQYTLAEDFQITADKDRIEQVITNFATNAIKYTPEDGHIWLRIYRHEGKANFILTNECPPLPDNALEQVWDSFYRVEEARSTNGTGLGLSIARAVIELHGGTVQARNTSEGVEFQFILP